MTSHASTSLALDSAPGPNTGSEVLGQDRPSQGTTAQVTAASQAVVPQAPPQATISQDTALEVVSHRSDVEELIQEAAVSARQLQLAARIIVRGAMRLTSCSTGAPKVSSALE